MDERPYPAGVDCCWLASDRIGQLGVFVTGGSGPIPTQALLPTYPLDQIEETILERPKASDIDLRVRVPRPHRFVALAERGVFVYDWSDVHRTEQYIDEYELMALPYRPLTLDLLPETLADSARAVRFSTVSFATAWRIDVRAHMASREASS
ncbi:MAG: hypothetical protein HC861_07090 [Rhodospirillaceae bacterium]|nr:hypothetical protein [Rhodospirillaceae bacterium]